MCDCDCVCVTVCVLTIDCYMCVCARGCVCMVAVVGGAVTAAAFCFNAELQRCTPCNPLYALPNIPLYHTHTHTHTRTHTRAHPHRTYDSSKCGLVEIYAWAEEAEAWVAKNT